MRNYTRQDHISSLEDVLGFKVGVTIDPLAIRHMCIPDDEDEDILESSFMSVSYLIECSVSSTLLDNKKLEEIEAFCS